MSLYCWILQYYLLSKFGQEFELNEGHLNWLQKQKSKCIKKITCWMYKNRRKKQKTTTDQKKGPGTKRKREHSDDKTHNKETCWIISTQEHEWQESGKKKRKAFTEVQKHRRRNTPQHTKSVIIKETQELTIAMTRGCNINKNSTKEEATLTHADDRSYWRHVIENTEVASDSGIKHPVTFVCFPLFFLMTRGAASCRSLEILQLATL